MESHGLFEENLRRLRKRHPALVETLARTDVGDVEYGVGARGAPTLRSQGVLLASAYDPEGEGEGMAEAIGEADLLVAIGFSLGHHVEAYRRRRRCAVVVFEPSPARLRAALSVRPLMLAGEPDVHFTTDLDQLSGLVRQLYAPGLRTAVFPHPASLRLCPDEVREAVRAVARAKNAEDVSTNTRLCKTQEWALGTIRNGPRLLRTPSCSRLYGAFRDVPAVVVAAGPSLDKQLPLLATEARGRLVIAIGQTLPALRSAGIEPDLVHAIESSDVSRQLLEAGDVSDLALVLPPSAHEALFDLPVRARFSVYPDPNPLGKWIGRVLGESTWLPGGATVAQCAVHLAAALGANPILLIGQDLAYTGGRVYAENSAYDFVGLSLEEDGRYRLTGHDEKIRQLNQQPDGREAERRRLLEVEGWDGRPVQTSAAYASFLEQYREIGALLAARGTRLVNCTEGGARIPGLEHRAFADALAEAPRASIQPRAVILAAHDTARPAPPLVFAEPLRRARSHLVGLEREARAGLARTASAAKALPRCMNARRKLDILRGVARCDRQVRRRLQALPWLDAFVQPEIHRAQTALRRAAVEGQEPEGAVEDSRLLCQGLVNAIDQAREALELFEVRIASEDASEGEAAAL